MFSKVRTFNRRGDQRITSDATQATRIGQGRIFIEQSRKEVLIQRSPVNPDSNGFAMVSSNRDHFGKLAVSLAALANVARVDAIFAE